MALKSIFWRPVMPLGSGPFASGSSGFEIDVGGPKCRASKEEAILPEDLPKEGRELRPLPKGVQAGHVLRAERANYPKHREAAMVELEVAPLVVVAYLEPVH